jgi:hypothetical protein
MEHRVLSDAELDLLVHRLQGVIRISASECFVVAADHALYHTCCRTCRVCVPARARGAGEPLPMMILGAR